jgi:hypothetical protein
MSLTALIETQPRQRLLEESSTILWAADFKPHLGYDAVGLADLVATRQPTPSELVEAAIEQVEAHNPQLNAVIRTQFDEAREKARPPQSTGPLPPLVLELWRHASDVRSGSLERRRSTHRVPLHGFAV